LLSASLKCYNAIAITVDIRHCYADITRIRTRLGYEPSMPLEKGFDDLAEWARAQKPLDRYEVAAAELASRGLVSGS